MLTLGSRFKARLQVRQNVFSSRFLWNFVLSSCFFLVFQEAEIHSAGGLRPSISIYDLHYLHCLHRQVATATPPFRIPFPRPWPELVAASTAAPAASSRWTTLSWPFWAAGCSDVQPRSARRGGWRWRSSKLHGEVVFFPSKTTPKRWKHLSWSGHRFGLDWETCSYITFVSADSEFQLPFTHSSMHWPSVWA